MSALTAQQTVDFLFHPAISGTAGMLNVNFFGGEPFLEMDRMEQIIDAALGRQTATKKVWFSATTNGTVATAEAVRLIRKARMALLVSLDGDDATNDSRRFTSGLPSYRAVQRNLSGLVESALDVTVRATYQPDRLNLLQRARHLFDLGAPAVGLSPVLEGDWSRSEGSLRRAYLELVTWLGAEMRQGRSRALEVSWNILRTLYRARTQRTEPERPCDIGNSLLSIHPDGHVMPCHRHLDKPDDWLGHVSQPERLSAHRRRYVDLTAKQVQRCRGCPTEVCGGGCRVASMESDRGFYGANPANCMNTRAHHAALVPLYRAMMAERNPVFLQTLLRGRAPSGQTGYATPSN